MFNIVAAALKALGEAGGAISFTSGVFTYTQLPTNIPEKNSSTSIIDEDTLRDIREQFNTEASQYSRRPVSPDTLQKIRNDFDFDTEVEESGIDLTRLADENIYLSVTNSLGETEDTEINFNSCERFSDLVKKAYGDSEYIKLKNDVVVYFENNIISDLEQCLIDRNVFPGDSIKIMLKEFSNDVYINLNNIKYNVVYKSNYTIYDLKTQIENVIGIPAAEQILSLEGKYVILLLYLLLIIIVIKYYVYF